MAPPTTNASPSAMSRALGNGTSGFSFRNAPPCPLPESDLRRLVLDFLINACAADTARTFVRDWPEGSAEVVQEVEEIEMDIDGDIAMDGVESASGDESSSDEYQTVQSELARVNRGQANGHSSVEAKYLPQGVLTILAIRRDIKAHVLAGRIQPAVDLCSTHFPSVLANTVTSSSRPPRPLAGTSPPTVRPFVARSLSSPSPPAHLGLDLQIQAFIERVRAVSAASFSAINLADSPPTVTAALLAPGVVSADSPTSASSTSSHTSTATLALAPALQLAQMLHTQAQALPVPADRARYIKELENVSGLMAYRDPETSPVNRFLDHGRRHDLAQRLDAAILASLHQDPVPMIERLSRQTSVVWSQLAENRVPFPPEKGREKARPKWTADFDLTRYLDVVHS